MNMVQLFRRQYSFRAFVISGEKENAHLAPEKEGIDGLE